MSSGPLSDITVVEFGQYIAVPACGQLLADAGARVIKVEPPEGDPARGNLPVVPGLSRLFINKNRGKHCIALNLRSPEGLAIARKLASTADVVLANFRPGHAATLGLDYETIRHTNPRVIYASNSGFGRRGDDASLAGFDGVVQAFSGLLLRSATPADDLPLDEGLPFTDFTAALLLTWGVTAALHDRDRTGEGQEVSTSLLAASLYLQCQRIMHIGKADGWHEDFLRQLPARKAEGQTWAEICQAADAATAGQVNRAYFGSYHAQDGTIVIFCGGRPLQRKLAQFFAIDDPWVEQRAWASPEIGKAETERVTREIQARIGEHTVQYWMETFHREGIPVSEVHHYLEMLEHPQAIANNLIYEFDHEQLGTTAVIGPPVMMEKTPLRPGFAPQQVGEDTAAILQELGYTPEEVANLARKGAVRTI